MAIVDEKTISSKDGIKKTIDKQSMGMALDILQRGLYSFPIKSTVRELASNAHDAIRERDVAVEIIKGVERVEDHFDVNKEDGIYHSSAFNPGYFDLNWLSDDPYVKIYYEEGTLRDTLRIVDNGVGLGQDRLLGYFTINYSSKRTNKDTLGRFGLGSKVALSLGVESFRVITRYNGMKFKFDVYLDKIESIIPKFGDSGLHQSQKLTEDTYEYDAELEEDVLVEGYTAYWEPTTEKNGVEVQIQVKKHNKNAFFEAIESQLMYMPNILFLHRELDGITHKPVDIKAQIEYKDENIVISKTTVYNKPHILLGTGDVLINYGFLAFNELEIEPRGGAVGLIMDINDIEVTPSRETPVWSTKTREAVLEKYSKVTSTATKYVNDEIKNETDYVMWIKKASSILASIRGNGAHASNSVLSTLASIIDVSEIKNITFAPDKTIVLQEGIKDMFGNSFTLRVIRWDRYDNSSDRTNAKDLSALSNPVYLTEKGANKYKDRYLYEEVGQFCLITAKDDHDIFSRSSLIMNSTAVTDYDAIVVPEDRLALYLNDGTDDDGEADDDLSSVSSKSLSELRKENKEIVVHEAYKNYNNQWLFTAKDVKISDMFNIKPGQNVMYGTGNDRNAMKTIMTLLPRYFTNEASSEMFSLENGDSPLTAMLIAKENLKHVSSSGRFSTILETVTDYYDDETCHLTLSSKIRYVITSILAHSFLEAKFGKEAGSTIPRIMRDWARSDKIIDVLEDDANAKEVSIFVKEVIKHVLDNVTHLPDSNELSFFKKLGRLHLAKAGLVEMSEEDIEDLISKVNSELPEYLCDDIDEILSVDAIYVDLFKNILRVSEKIVRGWRIISLFNSSYQYGDEEKLTAEEVKLYLKYKNNDASVQSTDNTED